MDDLLYKNNVDTLKKFYDICYDNIQKNIFEDEEDYRMVKVIEALVLDIDKHDEVLQTKISQNILKSAREIDVCLDDFQIGLDGICGWKQLYKFYNGKQEWIEAYRILRGSFYGNWIWPNKRDKANTINQIRSSKFGDRIDHTIFDIKMYYKYKDTGVQMFEKNCKMYCAFENKETKEFFDRIGSFQKFVSVYKLLDLFVENEEVYDLSKEKSFISEEMHDAFDEHTRWYKLDECYLKNILRICKSAPLE